MGMGSQFSRSSDHSTDTVKPEVREESIRRNVNVEPPSGLWDKDGNSTLPLAAGNKPSKRSGTPSSFRSPGAAPKGAAVSRSVAEAAKKDLATKEPQRGALAEWGDSR